jgi:hypothetical protein
VRRPGASDRPGFPAVKSSVAGVMIDIYLLDRTRRTEESAAVMSTCTNMDYDDLSTIYLRFRLPFVLICI